MKVFQNKISLHLSSNNSENSGDYKYIDMFNPIGLPETHRLVFTRVIVVFV